MIPEATASSARVPLEHLDVGGTKQLGDMLSARHVSEDGLIHSYSEMVETLSLDPDDD